MGVIGGSLCGALRIIKGKRVVSLLQSKLRSSRKARVLNIRTPTQLLFWKLRLFCLGLRRIRCVLPDIVSLSVDAAGYCDEYIPQSNLQEIESSKRRYCGAKARGGI